MVSHAYDEMTWFESQIDMNDGIWDDGCPDAVTVPCVRCGEPVTAQIDAGEPTTRDHPGMPPSWFVPETEECACMATYSRDEDIAFNAACDRAAYATEA